MPNPYLGAMIKPVDGRCNLGCTYCYYRPKPEILEHSIRLPLEDLERFTRQYLEISTLCPAMVWQGGEPLLAGRQFYESAIALQERHSKADAPVRNVIQSNGVLLDEEWAKFFARRNFLVGVSVDGPRELHNIYRKDSAGSHGRALSAIEKLRAAGAEFNVLVAVSDANVRCAEQVYRFFRETGISFIEIIPVAEIGPDGTLQPYSVSPEEYGRFLIELFDLWINDNPAGVHIRLIDNVVRSLFGIEPEYCIFRDTCFNVATIEADGSLYPCDFFVEERWTLGNIRTTTLESALGSSTALSFKRLIQSYAEQCLSCRWFQTCKGGCPKYRTPEFMQFAKGGNYFCESFRRIFSGIEETWKGMSESLQRSLRRKYGIPEAAPQGEPHVHEFAAAGRNDPCPCGSGRKFKHCCMKKMARR